jgi:hypothetical protein
MRKSVKDFGNFVRKDNYPELPEELKEFNYFLSDGETGHVIMAVPEHTLNKAEENVDELDDYECPVPVAYVLKNGYRLYKNHVICQVPYDEKLGMRIPEEYYEPSIISTDAGEAENPVSGEFPYEKRKCYPEFANHAEAVVADIVKDYVQIRVFFKNPTENEIAQFSPDARLKIRFTEMDGTCLFTVKAGDLSWMDAPYHAKLAKDLSGFDFTGEGEIPLYLLLIDSSNGEVKAVRNVQLSEEFSSKLRNLVDRQVNSDFDKKKYEDILSNIYLLFSSDELADASTIKCQW